MPSFQPYILAVISDSDSLGTKGFQFLKFESALLGSYIELRLQTGASSCGVGILVQRQYRLNAPDFAQYALSAARFHDGALDNETLLPLLQ